MVRTVRNTNTRCVHNAQFHIVAADGTYLYHWIKEPFGLGSTYLIMTALTVRGS
jgi:hypothetical protein